MRRRLWLLGLLVIVGLVAGVYLRAVLDRRQYGPPARSSLPHLVASSSVDATPSAESTSSPATGTVAVSTPRPVPTPARSTVAAARTPKAVWASVSKRYPYAGTSVTVTGRVVDAAGKGLKGATVSFTWRLSTGTVTMRAVSDANGVARATRSIGASKPGRAVTVTVRASAGGGTASSSVSFTPKAVPPKQVAAQKVYVDVSRGDFSPSTIHLKKGIPAVITFGQGGDCVASVRSSSLHFDLDLTSGPKSVRLGPLQPGTYGFECGMSMLFGSIIVS